MNDTKQPLRRMTLLFFAVALGLALVSAALRTVNLFFFFDSDPGYYVSGAVLPILEWVLLGLSVVLLIVGAIVLFRGKPIGYKKHTPLGVRIGAAFGALGFGWLLVTDIISYAGGAESANESATSGLLPILLGLAATAYFVLIVVNVKAEAVRLATGFCVILRLLTALSASYFNLFVPMNAPDKLMFQLGILSAMLFMINEIRATVSALRPVLYMACAGIATVFLGAAALPSLIAYYATVLNASYEHCNIALLGLFLYVIVRFLCLCLSPEREQEELEAGKADAEDNADSDEAEEDPEAEEPTIEPEEAPEAEEHTIQPEEAPMSTEDTPDETEKAPDETENVPDETEKTPNEGDQEPPTKTKEPEEQT